MFLGEILCRVWRNPVSRLAWALALSRISAPPGGDSLWLKGAQELGSLFSWEGAPLQLWDSGTTLGLETGLGPWLRRFGAALPGLQHYSAASRRKFISEQLHEDRNLPSLIRQRHFPAFFWRCLAGCPQRPSQTRP